MARIVSVYLLSATSLFIFILNSRTFATFVAEDFDLKYRDVYQVFSESLSASTDERASLIWQGLDNDFSSKPTLAATEFDCKIRELAFDFAKKLSAGRPVGNTELKYVFDGLELDALCNRTFSTSSHNRKNSQANTEETLTLNVFVDSENGKDEHNVNFMHKPFKTIQYAIDECIKIRRNQNYKCNVLIRGGAYTLNETLAIKDSNVVLSSYKDENVIVTSDKVVYPKWKPFKSSLEIYKNLNPLFEGIKPKESTRSIVYLGITDSYIPCENMCFKISNCSSFVYFDNTTAEFAHQCYIRSDGMWNTLSHTGVTSGKKVSTLSFHRRSN